MTRQMAIKKAVDDVMQRLFDDDALRDNIDLEPDEYLKDGFVEAYKERMAERLYNIVEDIVLTDIFSDIIRYENGLAPDHPENLTAIAEANFDRADEDTWYDMDFRPYIKRKGE